MGVHVYAEENTSPVAPSRLFKALIGDSETLMPKLLPQVVKSISLLEGTIGKIKATYVTKGDEPPTEEDRKKGKEISLAMFKVVEGYLQQNPDAYV
ncbi:unnamed protein product [Linum tenue]|uniref:Bet v I/Major latex protein domain-containing protein n=1 Tax=Linum tenue TaxID=586396 RepID=A0AAV0P8N5_9ROSI|nr:unnamed protein product [Linum tenue]